MSVAGLGIGAFPLLTFVLAVAVIWGLQFLFYKSRLGMLFRAASDDPATLGLMGADNRKVYALAMAVAFAVVALAGVLMASRTNFDPTIGPGRLLFAFEAVIMGGLGSLWGVRGHHFGRRAGDWRRLILDIKSWQAIWFSTVLIFRLRFFRSVD